MALSTTLLNLFLASCSCHVCILLLWATRRREEVTLCEQTGEEIVAHLVTLCPDSAESISLPTPSTRSGDWRQCPRHCRHGNIHRTRYGRASGGRFGKSPQHR